MHTSAQPRSGAGTFFVTVAMCLLGVACESTPSSSASDGLSDEGEGPHECDRDEDCEPDEVCVQDYIKTCERSCEARQPDIEMCGCAEGRYCPPGQSCPTIGCEPGQLCTSGECHDVGLAGDCEEPTGWSLNTTVVEADLDLRAIRLAHLDLDATPELVLLRPVSIQMLGGPVWTRPEMKFGRTIRAANIAGEPGQLLVAGHDEAWLYTSVLGNDGDVEDVELRETFELANLADAQLGDFAGGPELDVWLLSGSGAALYVGDEASGFAEPLSFDMVGGDDATVAADLDLDGRSDIARRAEVWFGDWAPAWSVQSLLLEPPAWLGSPGSVQSVAIPEGLAIAWTVADQYHTAISSYLELDSRDASPTATTILYEGRPDQLIGSAGPSDDGWLAIKDNHIVVYRQLADQYCRALTPGTGSYREGQLDSSTGRLFLLTKSGAVEEWLRP